MVVRSGEESNFAWGRVEGAEFYRFKLYEGNDTSDDPVYEDLYVEATSIDISMDGRTEGNYTWTVQAFTNEGILTSRRTGFLDSGHFEMRLLKPVRLDYPEPGRIYAGLDASRRPDTLRWTSVDTPGESRLILSRNPALSSPILETRNPGTSIRLPRLSEGDYYWTIRAETTDGFDISAEAPAWFRVLPIPRLPAAGNRIPVDGYVLGPTELRNQRNITFSWSAVSGANSYLFVLVHEADGEERRRLLEADTENDISYTLENMNLLERGEFTWRVEAITKTDDGFIEQRGELGENRLTVDLPEIPRSQPGETGILYGKQ
jgi:hypothetical protein